MAHLGEVRDHLVSIESAGGRVLAVSFAAPAMAAAYRDDNALPFPVASDEPRAAYRAYGIPRGPVQQVWRPSAVVQHLALRLRGFKPGRHAQRDTAQLGGDFVIGSDGRLRLAHPSVAGDDRVAVSAIVAALAARP